MNVHRGLAAAAASLVLLGLLATSGCSGAAPRSGSSGPVSQSEAGVGDTLPLGPELSVTLVSMEPTAPQGVASDAVPDAVWLVMEVANSTDGTVTLSSRPHPPEVLDSDGDPLEVAHASVSLRGGGGGWGAAASALGEPYLRPGGAMRTVVAVLKASAEEAGRPLTIRYAPFLRYGAEFSVK